MSLLGVIPWSVWLWFTVRVRPLQCMLAASSVAAIRIALNRRQNAGDLFRPRPAQHWQFKPLTAVSGGVRGARPKFKSASRVLFLCMTIALRLAAPEQILVEVKSKKQFKS